MVRKCREGERTERNFRHSYFDDSQRITEDLRHHRNDDGVEGAKKEKKREDDDEKNDSREWSRWGTGNCATVVHCMRHCVSM